MKSTFSAMFYTASLATLCLFLSACSDTHLNVQAPPETSAAKSNIKNKSNAPQIERKLFDSSAAEPAKDIDSDDEDEATQTLLHTAERMVQTHDFVSAKVLYQRALGTNPDSIAALKGLAHMSELQQKPQEALQAYRDILRLDNGNITAHRGVAKNLMTLGIYDKAVDQLNKLRAIKGDDVETLNLLGVAYTREEHYAEAEETLQTALTLDPENLNTQNNLGFTYILAGKLPEAIALFETLTDSPRASVQHRQNLALAYGLAGREKDARNIAMQDLPRSAVEKNIQSYRLMRERAAGHSPPSKPAAKKTRPKAAPAVDVTSDPVKP